MRIVEVGPRDGLQNEATPVPTDMKLRFIRALGEAGLKEIEATSFVSPKWVPQLADAAELWPQLPPGPRYSALVPNRKGLERAMALGVRHIAVFTAASEAFTLRNINMTISQSLEEFRELMAAFSAVPEDSKTVRGYVSTAFECPYAGRVAPTQVVEVVDRLFELGVDEVSLGDTIGVAVPGEVRELARALQGRPKERIAWHFHDTNGTAIANVAQALELGYTVFDASAGGLGGCPYAPGAGGNLATEDLAYFLARSGISPELDLERLARSSLEVLNHLGRPASSKAQVAAVARAGRCAT